MARYRHVASGALVSVRDDKVMDSSWESVDDSKADEKRAPAKKVASKSADKS